jgi:hypothetical protein
MWDTDILPDVEGRNVGLPDQRYDGNFRNLNISGIVSGNFTGLAIFNLGQIIVPFSATPIFDALASSSFIITLTGNVTVPSIVNMKPGQLVAFVIKQDAVGGRAFPWPANVFGAADIGTGPNEITSQLFLSDGVNLYAQTPGVIF